MSTWAAEPAEQQKREAQRPQVYDQVEAPGWWSQGTTGASMLIGANAVRNGLSFGDAMGKGFLHPAGLAGMYANPAARVAQAKADHHFITNARQHDMQAGLPTKLSSTPLRELARAAFASQRQFYKLSAQTPPRPPRTFMGSLRGMGGRAALLGAGAVGLGLASVGYRTAMDGWNEAAEEQRFRAARKNLGDFSRLGDHGLRYMAETDPQAVEAHLRNTFKVINRYSPSVAADPRLSEQYLLRLGGDPRYGTPADQYAEEVKRLVDLENAIQRSRPDLFDGAASYARNLL